MIITLVAKPFLIHFNFFEKSKLDKNQDVYKFSLTFTHYCNKEITFSLPKGYQTYLWTNDILRLVDDLSTKIKKLTENSQEKDICLDFEKHCFVNSEHDIEIMVNSGEYYADEDDGLLYLIFFFNVNVAYKESGATMIGFQSHATLSNMKKFINDFKGLADK